MRGARRILGAWARRPPRPPTPTPRTVDEYLDGLPDEVAARLRQVREAIRAEVPGGEERIRYGMPAMMLGGRYALHSPRRGRKGPLDTACLRPNATPPGFLRPDSG